jgi:RNA polymerase sigma-70 factor (ECF subfamily)
MKTPNVIPPEGASTRYSLLTRLQKWDDQESWKDFFDTYWRLIYSLALKSGLTEHEAQDVVQETVISVAKSIHKFERDRSLGSFKAWLKNIIRWRIADQLRKRPPPTVGVNHFDQSDSTSLEDIPDPNNSALESAWEDEWQTHLFNAALERVKGQVKEEHYQAFDLYVMKQWTAIRTARFMGIGVGQVYVAKHHVSGLIRKEVKRMAKQPW